LKGQVSQPAATERLAAARGFEILGSFRSGSTAREVVAALARARARKAASGGPSDDVTVAQRAGVRNPSPRRRQALGRTGSACGVTMSMIRKRLHLGGDAAIL